MLQSISRSWAFLAAGAMVAALSGCAATRSTFDVPVQVAQKEQKGAVSSPTTYVNIVRVTDSRQFEANPRSPSTPSLQNPAELGNPAITSRAIARKRGGFGNAMADILLPEGRTVEQLVRESAISALREKGFGVVEANAPIPAGAIPLDISIRQFWSWFTPGFFTISLEFEGIVVIKGNVLVEGESATVRGYSRVQSMAATDDEWLKTMKLGVDDLTAKIKSTLRTP